MVCSIRMQCVGETSRAFAMRSHLFAEAYRAVFLTAVLLSPRWRAQKGERLCRPKAFQFGGRSWTRARLSALMGGAKSSRAPADFPHASQPYSRSISRTVVPFCVGHDEVMAGWHGSSTLVLPCCRAAVLPC